MLADRNVSALSVDGMGQLWIGYFDHGLDIVDPGFTRARHIEDQHLFCVNRIVHGATTAWRQPTDWFCSMVAGRSGRCSAGIRA